MVAERIRLDTILEHHDLSREQMVDLAIMIGTDFHPGVRGIGPKRGLALIKRLGTIETILEETDHDTINDLDVIRSIFLEHPTSDDPIPPVSPIDEKALREFLIEQRGFSERRVTESIKNAGKPILAGGQTRLTDFFN